MVSLVQKQAEETLREALEKALADGRVRERTRESMRKISQACKVIVDRGGQLTISDISRQLDTLFPESHPAEQSIRNNTPSGRSYRKVIAAWRVYTEGLSKIRKAIPASEEPADFPDMLLSILEPREARFRILAMRTALRNLRSQMQIIQSVSPGMLVRHTTSQSQLEPAPTSSSRRNQFNTQELEALRALLNETELTTRGYQWDKMGRLCTLSGGIISRAGLRSALEKAVGAL